jgi:hypothetical protein
MIFVLMLWVFFFPGVCPLPLLLVSVDSPEKVSRVVGTPQASLDPGPHGLLLQGCGLDRVVVAGLRKTFAVPVKVS